MHIKFDGEIKEALVRKGMPDQASHAAHVGSVLKPAMDQYVVGGKTPFLIIPLSVRGTLSEARKADSAAYDVWVATIAAELVKHPDKYAEQGYTVPWKEVTEPWIKKMWTSDEPPF